VKKLHWPTFITLVILVFAVVGLYHVAFGRK
jgi:hypothetical protein